MEGNIFLHIASGLALCLHSEIWRVGFGWIYLSLGISHLLKHCCSVVEIWMNACEYPSGFLPPLPSAWHLYLATAYFSITLGCELQLKSRDMLTLQLAATLGWEGETAGAVILFNHYCQSFIAVLFKSKMSELQALKGFTAAFFMWGSWSHISACLLLRATLHQLLQVP